jgi:hypothetical protein
LDARFCDWTEEQKLLCMLRTQEGVKMVILDLNGDIISEVPADPEYIGYGYSTYASWRKHMRY